MKLQDLTGQKFGNLTAIQFDERRSKRTYWVWKCDCGNTKSIWTDSVKRGLTKTCGKCTTSLIDRTGQIFNALTAIELDRIENKRTYWWCRCECGNVKSLRADHFTSGQTKSCNECDWVQIDITGHVYGMLTVIRFLRKDPERGGQTIWLCKCECGNELESIMGPLRTGNVYSCGCMWHQKGRDSYRWTGGSYISGSYWASLLKGAQSRDLNVSVTLEDIDTLFDIQLAKCSLTGLPLTVSTFTIKGTASLDRIDSSQGYVMGNLHWVHKDVNQMKNHYSLERFLEICALVENPRLSESLVIDVHMDSKHWSQIKRGARKRSLFLNIDEEYITTLFRDQNGVCALTGLVLNLSAPHRTASLDRIDSSVGYEPHNVQWLHKDVNIMKHVFSQDYFIEMCTLIASQAKRSQM